MLDPDRFTREELYEAVWAEPGQKLAEALGISDVGLAKICKKLNVPRPGRGYWAKSRGARKALRKSLPPLRDGQDDCYSISGGGSGWTREALRQLAGEGLAVPTAATVPSPNGVHPLISQFQEVLAMSGLAVNELLSKKACLAVCVSPPALDRSLRIMQTIFEAFEAQGLRSEVIPPNPNGRNRYGFTEFQPSRTGVWIKDVFVAFELREAYQNREVNSPSPEVSTPSKRGVYEPPPRPAYQKVGLGELTLEIVDPNIDGMRKRWHDRAPKKLEDQLNAFFRAVLSAAERQHQVKVEQEEKQRVEDEARLRAHEEAARKAELASRMHDLESRLQDFQHAEAIRRFTQAVLQDAERRGLDIQPATKLGDWLAWANRLAEQLEQSALQTLSSRRIQPKSEPESKPTYRQDQAEQTELVLRNEVDLWRRRYIYGRR